MVNPSFFATSGRRSYSVSPSSVWTTFLVATSQESPMDQRSHLRHLTVECKCDIQNNHASGASTRFFEFTCGRSRPLRAHYPSSRFCRIRNVPSGLCSPPSPDEYSFQLDPSFLTRLASLPPRSYCSRLVAS